MLLPVVVVCSAFLLYRTLLCPLNPMISYTVMCIFILSKFFISFHFQMFYLLFHKTLEQNYWIKRYVYIKLWQMLPNFSKVVHHFHSFKQWMRVHILTNTQHFPSFLIFIIIVVDKLNVLLHIYYLWTYFSVTFPFRVFLPSHFSVGLPVSSFRSSLCILHIPDISLLLDICFWGFWFCFVCLFCLCWLGVSCDRQAFHCSMWASLQLQHARFRAHGLSSCSMWAQLPWGMWDLSSLTRD